MQTKARKFKPNPRVPYSNISATLNSIKWGKLIHVGNVSDYPFYAWRYRPQGAKAKVLISAGIHGDEPSGVEAILLLLKAQPNWLTSFDLTIFPCTNPWGYERNVRGNENQHDVNRQWRHENSDEVRLCKKVLGNHRYNLTCCLHEDYDGTGFYLYELSLNQTHFGDSVIKHVSRYLPVESRKIVEKRRCIHGVIERPVSAIRTRKFWPEALYHIAHHSEHTLTLETPTSFPIEERIRGQIEGLKSALRLLKLTVD